MTGHRFLPRTARRRVAALLFLAALCAFPIRVLALWWLDTGDMRFARDGHTATLLADGKVLIAGGQNPAYPVTAELYDPGAGEFTSTGTIGDPRAYHTATPLADGRVLIAGGTGANGDLASAELFDPGSGEFAPTGAMGGPRTHHTATLLVDGRVLIAGGTDNATALASAEVYDPATETFAPTGPMGSVRADHTATRLADGKVLVAGGADNAVALSSAEEYDPAAGTFAPAGAMGEVRSNHTASLLADGRVLIAGGGSGSGAAELYDPLARSFASTGAMQSERSAATATLLSDGRVLVAGGIANATFLTSAEVYDAGTGTFTPVGPMGTGRARHAATRLPDGKVLVAGGVGAAGPLASAEAYYLQDVDTPTVASTNPLPGATGVPTNQPIAVTFDRLMDASTIVPEAFVLTGPGGAVACASDSSGRQATFTPAASLADNTAYTATVKSTVQDASGVPLGRDYTWTFTTAAPSRPEPKQGLDYVAETLGCTVVGRGAAGCGIGGPVNAVVLLIPAIVLLFRRRR